MIGGVDHGDPQLLRSTPRCHDGAGGRSFKLASCAGPSNSINIAGLDEHQVSLSSSAPRLRGRNKKLHAPKGPHGRLRNQGGAPLQRRELLFAAIAFGSCAGGYATTLMGQSLAASQGPVPDASRNLDRLKDPASLVVRGRIQRGVAMGRAGHMRYACDARELLSLPCQRIATSTIWTPRQTFEGPALASVLQHVGARGRQLRLDALDDYRVTIPWEDMERYGIILAHSADEQRLRPGRFGPLWLVYPRDQFASELEGPMAQAKFIWQVRSIEVL